MTFQVVWHGIDELEAAFTKMAERAQVETRNGVIEAAHMAEAAMKVRAGEGGRHKKGTPTPATPGGGPAVITGTLRRSIGVGSIEKWGAFGYQTKVGPTSIYGRAVELLYDYPYTSTGLEDVLPRVPEVFKRAWARALHG